jgi:23S rRNA (uridine2552-2'-O)-methyltransferase
LPQNNIHLLKADVLAEDFESRLAKVHPDRFDVIMSDMAPQTTGIASVDKTRSIVLAEQVMSISLKLLKPGGNQVIKVLEGADFHPFLKNIKLQFSKVNSFKPPASRKGSSEIFIVARGLKTI